MPTRRAWLAAGLGLIGCGKREPLPVFATVPAFSLTAQDGVTFDSSLLRGKPWLASFFFASCQGPCPRLNTQIYDLQERTYQYKDLRIVSFTVDPEHDTPEVLGAYAKRYKADPARWFFLTGERERISAVARDGFQVGALDAAQSHSTRIMLVDRAFRVRGHYPVTEKEEYELLLQDISKLYEEGS